MATVRVELTHIADARNLRVLGVQLASPFVRGPKGQDLEFSERTKLPIWNAQQHAADTRVFRAKQILEMLCRVGGADTPPDVIVFPEYSLPRQAHEDGFFQAFADEHRCILIPGSYVDDVATPGSDTFQRNMCRIYIPDAAAPIMIGKRNLTPLEGRYVRPFDGANVAQLLWTPPGRDTVTLSVFLCRDYLMPYDDDRGSGDEGPPVRRLDLDWEREGLNIGLLHSSDTRLFEGVAGLDVRHLRGKPKIVFLVNNAKVAPDLGSALFAPAGNRERDDIVRSLPPDREGVLTAELRLWDVRRTVMSPDRDVDEPVGYIGAELDLWGVSSDVVKVGQPLDSPVHYVSKETLVDLDGKLAVLPITEEGNPQFRGIWRPAFLAARRLDLTLEFYEIEHLNRAIALARKELRRSYAGIVRGQSDLLVRRYADVEEVDHVSRPDFIAHVIEDQEAQEELRRTLHDPDRTTMTVVIRPRDIWKYRGQDTYEGARFPERVKALKEALDFPEGSAHLSRLLDEIVRYAVECDEGWRPSKELAPFFYDAPEKVIPVRPHAETRETYMFLDARHGDKGPGDHFEKNILRGHLMKDPRVREIMKISEVQPTPFNYLLKLKCKAHEADEIHASIREWTAEYDLSCGMRTIDIMEYLARDSVAGIESTNQPRSLVEFVQELKGPALGTRDPVIAELTGSKMRRNKPLLKACAEAWHQCRQSAVTSECRVLRTDILRIFAFMVMYSERAENTYVDDASLAWFKIFQRLEGAANEELDALYRRTFHEDPPLPFIRNDRLKERYYPSWDAQQWGEKGKNREDSIKVAFRLLQEGCRDADLVARLKAAPGSIDKFRVLRNHFVHARPAEAQAYFNLRVDEPMDKLRWVQTTVIAMLGGIDALREAGGTD